MARSTRAHVDTRVSDGPSTFLWPFLHGGHGGCLSFCLLRGSCVSEQAPTRVPCRGSWRVCPPPPHARGPVVDGTRQQVVYGESVCPAPWPSGWSGERLSPRFSPGPPSPCLLRPLGGHQHLLSPHGLLMPQPPGHRTATLLSPPWCSLSLGVFKYGLSPGRNVG